MGRHKTIGHIMTIKNRIMLITATITSLTATHSHRTGRTTFTSTNSRTSTHHRHTQRIPFRVEVLGPRNRSSREEVKGPHHRSSREEVKGPRHRSSTGKGCFGETAFMLMWCADATNWKLFWLF